MTPAAQLERLLHEEIPISRAMGIRVAGYDGASLQLAAPLAPNFNHKLTAFGGSLYSLAVLCGWGLLHLKLTEAGVHKHIVIHEANIRYLLPVAEDMQAECRLDAPAFGRMLRTLEKHDRARIALQVSMHAAGYTALEFEGKYVVHG